MSRRTWIAVLSGLVVLVVGAGVVLTVVLSSSDSGEDGPSDPVEAADLQDEERDAAWACAVAAELPDPFDEDALNLGQPHGYRAIAAGSLANAAARAGDEWSGFEQPGMELMKAASTLNDADANSAAESLRAECADAPETSFAGDLELACEIVGVVPTDLENAMGDKKLESPVLWELMAVGILGYAADTSDDPLPEGYVDASKDIYKGTNTLNLDLVTSGASTVREVCGEPD